MGVLPGWIITDCSKPYAKLEDKENVKEKTNKAVVTEDRNKQGKLLKEFKKSDKT